MSFNKIIIVGNCGRDPELKYTPQGQAVCNISVATSEKRKNNLGEAEESVTWFRVTLWGRQAEVAQQYLTKGSQVYVEGRLRQNSYTDRDGNARSSLEVNATDLQFIGTKRDGEPSGQQSNRASDKGSGSSKTTSADAEWDDLTGSTDPTVPF